MGLIKAVLSATSNAFAEQWKEYFYCDAMDKDVLVVKGQKKLRNGSNTSQDNIISSGSKVIVNDGQAAIIVDQGQVVEFCAEPGEYIFDTSTQPSIFNGTLKEGVSTLFNTMTERFTYGGDAASDQRIYYFNLKVIDGNKFGTPTPVLFRIYDKNANLDLEVGLRCNGLYSYKITNPLLFYKNVCGNVTSDFKRSSIDEQLKGAFMLSLQPALAKLSDLGIRPSAIPAHVKELCLALNDELSKEWSELRGIDIVEVVMNPVSLSDEDMAIIQEAQKVAMLKDPELGHAKLMNATAEAMKIAAGNEAGAAVGFMGLNMAGQNVTNAANLYAANVSGNNVNAGPSSLESGSDGWACECGHINKKGAFCSECGKPKPVKDVWTCACGKENTGRFCSECGKPKPEAHKTCAKCGTVLETDAKFCPECGSQV